MVREAERGAQADTVCFTEYVQKNMALYEITNGIKLSTPAAASFVRNELAVALRKGPYQTNLLLGGFDESTGASLYYLDYLASSNKVNYGCHGHVSSFVLSIFDREWKPNMSEAEGLPAQGFNGPLVEHNDMETYIGDWMTEYGSHHESHESPKPHHTLVHHSRHHRPRRHHHHWRQ